MSRLWSQGYWYQLSPECQTCPMCRITGEQRGYTFRTREKRMDKCPLSPYMEWDVTCDPEYRDSHFDTDEWGQ